MGKSIKSTDTLKPIIVKLLKAKAGASKVTNVKESKDADGNDGYEGSCFIRQPGVRYYTGLGVFFVHTDAVMNASWKARTWINPTAI